MKKNMFYLIISMLFLFSQVSHAQWVQVTEGLEDFGDRGFAIDASDSNTIVFSATSKYIEWPEFYRIFLTSNGGNTWKNIRSPFNHEFEDISIVDSLHIWGAVGNGQIYSTLDGGLNWTLQFYDTTLTKFMNYIEMFDSNNGIAMGDGLTHDQHPAVFLRTTDGGNTWISMNDSSFGGVSGGVWSRLDFVDINIGYFFASGINPPKLFKTVNGGQSWEYANFSGGLTILNFYNEKIGLFYDISERKIMRTIDASSTWQTIDITVTGWGNDFEFLPNDPSKIWFTDGPSLFYSADTGRTWVEQNIHNEDLETRDIVFTDDRHGWILCDNGKLFYTNNNGGMITAVEKEHPNIFPTEFYLEQNYPNPFNPTTIIKYSIPVVDENFSSTTNVTLKIYDILGKEIATLVNEEKLSGNYSIEFNAKNLTSGIYYCRIISNNYSSTKKMILLK